jgi:hypothetical protein
VKGTIGDAVTDKNDIGALLREAQGAMENEQ